MEGMKESILEVLQYMGYIVQSITWEVQGGKGNACNSLELHAVKVIRA